MRVVLVAIASTSAAMPALAQGGGRGGIDTLWANNCLRCHGENGEGGGAGTSTLLDDQYLTPGTERDLFQSIKNGHLDHGMEAFGETLSDPEVWGLVVWIREHQARERAKAQPKTQTISNDTQHHKFRVEDVVSSGLSVPWSLEFLPGGELLITNRSGDLVTFKDGQLSEAISGTPKVRNFGQGGLMEVKLHPRFATNGWVYLAYSDPADIDLPADLPEARRAQRTPAMTRLVRGKIRGGAWVEEEILFESPENHYTTSPIHFGCKIAFDPKDAGFLFFTHGERGSGELAQDLTRANGKVHRIKDDGTIPADNPFHAREDNTLKTVWSYGHRNPQGLVFDLDGNLWDTEHGPRGGDELNLITKGANYGWPLVSFGINYNGAPLVTPWADVQGVDQQIAMPTDIWLPSIGASGLAVVKGDMFPNWKGDLLAGGLSGANVDRLRIKEGKVVERERIFWDVQTEGRGRGAPRVRDVQIGPDGSVYVVLNAPDKIVRLVRAD